MKTIKKILLGTTLAAACSVASASGITSVVMGALKLTPGNSQAVSFDSSADALVPGMNNDTGVVTVTVNNDGKSSNSNGGGNGGNNNGNVGNNSNDNANSEGGNGDDTGGASGGDSTEIVLGNKPHNDHLDDVIDLVIHNGDKDELGSNDPIQENGFAALNEQDSNVPEPASLGLLGIAVLGMAASRRKQK